MAKARMKQGGPKDKPRASIDSGPSGLARATLAISPKLEEPWVELPNGLTLANWNLSDEVAYNQVNRQTEKALMFRRTFDFIKDNRIGGDYQEFGCHRCRTFRMALSEARLPAEVIVQIPDVRVHALTVCADLVHNVFNPDHTDPRVAAALQGTYWFDLDEWKRGRSRAASRHSSSEHATSW